MRSIHKIKTWSCLPTTVYGQKAIVHESSDLQPDTCKLNMRKGYIVAQLLLRTVDMFEFRRLRMPSPAIGHDSAHLQLDKLVN